MKKSKFTLSCLAGVLGLTTVICAGCGCSNGNGGGSGGEVTPPGPTNPGGNGGTTENPNPEQPSNPVLQSINNSFNKARANYSTNEILNENGTKKTFSELLDRQFDVLAEDILYRLYVTYGENTYGAESDFGDLMLNNGSYSLNGNNAKVIKNNLLTNSTEHTSNHLNNIDCSFCYQSLINNNTNSMLNHNNFLKITEAINGEYYYYDSNLGLITSETEFLYDSNGDGVVDNYTTYDPTPYKWQFSDYSKWNTEYREQFKLALAKIVYGNEQTTLGYSELLNKINHLGFTANDGEKIVNYINNSVIGTNLIEENLRIYNMFSESDKSNLKNWSNPDEIDKHYYKGYNIVVPAIVNQALNNTFDGTVGLYPTVDKNVSSVLELDNLKTEKDYKQIVLMPKHSNVLVTKINAKFYSTNSENKNVKVYATVKNVAGALVTKKEVGNVNLSSVGTQVELNIGCQNTIGLFTGDLTNNDTVSLFGDNNKLISLGDNYVELSFEYEDGVTFGVEFVGMYDKN